MKFIIKINNKIVLLKGNPDLLGKGFSNGQGIVESVVAVGILMMVLTGAVLLISSGISSRKVGFDRRKANELATLVMEEQVGKSINEAANFWKLTDILTPQTKPEYPGYSYTLDFTNILVTQNIQVVESGKRIVPPWSLMLAGRVKKLRI